MKDGIVQLVEYWNHNPRVMGSSPFSVSVLINYFEKRFVGDYSSVVEYLIVDQKVMGSIPINYPYIDKKTYSINVLYLFESVLQSTINKNLKLKKS